MQKEEEQRSSFKEMLIHDIVCLKELLLIANEHVNCLSHPLMIKISEMLDQKLNQYHKINKL